MDLDDLLDDALADFDKQPSEVAEVKKTDSSVDGPVTSGETSKEPKDKNNDDSKNEESKLDGDPSMLLPPNDVFNQFFSKDMSETLQAEWDSAMKELAEDDPQLATQLKNLSTTLESASEENLGAAGGAPATSSERKKPMDINEAMTATISGMQQSADELKNMTGASAEEKLLRDMKNMGLGLGGVGDMMGEMGDAEGLENNFMNMMEGMMQNLLSKDILYPTMKQISAVYPGWLESNNGKVPQGDFHKYKRQSIIIEKICQNFESEKEGDTDEVKKQKLNDLMNLVEEMQDCGNPPPDMMEGCGPPVDMDKIFGSASGPGGNMFNPNDMNPENCAVM